MRHFVSAVCGLWLCLAGPLSAQGTPAVVVELYTSQGCSSCPPADEFLAMLTKDPSIIPLALHVDYWDYIGWEDRFADPKYTARQRAYARAKGSRTVYTPQMVVGGIDFVEGTAPTEVATLIRNHRAVQSPVTLTVDRKGGKIVIRVVADPPLSRMTHIQLVRYNPSQTVTINRGENAGRTLTYQNIVTAWDVLADWPGQEPIELSAPLAGTEPAVVIVQTDGPSQILAAQLVR